MNEQTAAVNSQAERVGQVAIKIEDLQEVQQILLGALDDSLSKGECWEGQLSDSALSTATAISAMSFYLQAENQNRETGTVQQARSLIEAGLKWLGERQNSDGGWGDTSASFSNISTTQLVIAAVTIAGHAAEWRDSLTRASAYVESSGGVAGIRDRYGDDRTFSVPILANAAMAGLVPWCEVSALPFEATLIPQRFFHWLQLPVVSYAVPALVAMGQVKFVKDPPRNPLVRWLRGLAVKPSLRLLAKMQPQSGGFLEAVPLTSFVVMALINAGQGGHPVVERGIGFILSSVRNGSSWPIDTNLATWNTTLTINALGQSWPKGWKTTEQWRSILLWILSCQFLERHPFTFAAPGGWGWTNLSGAVPDADDTPGALLALRHLSQEITWTSQERAEISESAGRGVKWLLGLQNRDGGWPTFCRGWGRFPFDRSGADITAHVIRGLIAWKTGESQREIDQAIERGFGFLERQQRSDGSWLPLWFGNQDQPDDENPYYGTAKVLLAYREGGRLDTQAAKNGLNWLRTAQAASGGWGGGPSVRGEEHPDSGFPLGTATLEETALCLEALISAGSSEDHEAIGHGL